MDWRGWNISGSAPLWSLCMLPGWATPRLWAKQSWRNLWCHNRQAPNIMFPSTYLPGIHQSSKTNIYSVLLEFYYNLVLDRYWTTALHKLISTGSDQSTFPWIVRTLVSCHLHGDDEDISLIKCGFRQLIAWTVGCMAQLVERRSLTGELSLSCARPAADGWPLMWVNHPL